MPECSQFAVAVYRPQEIPKGEHRECLSSFSKTDATVRLSVLNTTVNATLSTCILTNGYDANSCSGWNTLYIQFMDETEQGSITVKAGGAPEVHIKIQGRAGLGHMVGAVHRSQLRTQTSIPSKRHELPKDKRLERERGKMPHWPRIRNFRRTLWAGKYRK